MKKTKEIKETEEKKIDLIKVRKGHLSKTIFFYLFSETLFAFFVSFLFFFFIFFVNQLLLMAQEILTKKVPFNQVALLVLFSIPSILAMSTPFATLLGTLMTIGRMSSDNEVLVMLSSGLSYKNVYVPTLLVGILVSIVSFFANDVLLPAGTIQFTRLYRKILVSTPALEMESNSVKRFKDTVVITGNVSGNSISDLFILDRTSDGERRVILAKNSEFIDAGKEGLRLDLGNAFVLSTKEQARTDYDYARTEYLRYRIQIQDLTESTVSSIGPREMSSRDVLTSIREKEDDLQYSLFERNNRTLETAFDFENTLRIGPPGNTWSNRDNFASNFQREYQITEAIKKDRNLSIFRLEFYKKFSIPFGSLSFIFLAVPLGLLAKKSGQTVGFILGLNISVLYWALLIGGQNMGLRLGFSPFWSMWMSNVFFLVIGVILSVIRIRR